jgi:hypothetical protein
VEQLTPSKTKEETAYMLVLEKHRSLLKVLSPQTRRINGKTLVAYLRQALRGDQCNMAI